MAGSRMPSTNHVIHGGILGAYLHTLLFSLLRSGRSKRLHDMAQFDESLENVRRGNDPDQFAL